MRNAVVFDIQCSAHGHLSPSYLYRLLEYRVKFIMLIGHAHFHLTTADMRPAHLNKHRTTTIEHALFIRC